MFLFVESLQSSELVLICCYAERYFLAKLARNERILFHRPFQERIDFEFFQRKLDGVKLSDGLQRLIHTFVVPEGVQI